MGAIVDLIKSFWRLFIWWVVINPWELGLRVRLGKRRGLLVPGLHFRIPYADAIYKQSVRLRWSSLSPQTVTTLDGETLTMCGQLAYEVVDVDKLYDTLHQAESALRSMAQGAVASFVHSHSVAECSPALVEAGALAALDLARFGVVPKMLQLTTFCRVKTFRLIQDSHDWIGEDLLNTLRDDSPAKAP